jgi:hypothetical protein
MKQALEVKGYQARKALGLCVRDRCEEKPKKKADGTRRSYCATHNAQNKKHADAFYARQNKAAKAHKVKKAKAAAKKAAAVTPEGSNG